MRQKGEKTCEIDSNIVSKTNFIGFFSISSRKICCNNDLKNVKLVSRNVPFFSSDVFYKAFFLYCCSKLVCLSLSDTLTHRYWKSLNRLLKVCYVPSTSTVLIFSFSSFFAAAINSTNEANKAADTCH